VAAFTVSAVAMADSALAFTFYPLDLSGLSGIGSPAVANGTVLQGPTNYFGDRFNDGTKNKLGTFTITLVDQDNAAADRPIGNDKGDLVLGVDKGKGGGFLTIQIDFSPLNGKTQFLPGVKVSQLSGNGPAGPTSPFDPFADPTDKLSQVILDGASWVGGSTDPRFVGGASGNVLEWTYDTEPSTVASSDIDFAFNSTDTLGSLFITYKSDGKFVNNAGFNISTAYVPTPALLPGLIGLGVAALRKRNEEEADQA
jgi:hypothetical protein